MNFVPVNNYLYVRTVEDNESEDSGILLPQDYRSVESPFAVVELRQAHTTSNNVLWAFRLRLAVEAHMLRDIDTTVKPSRSLKKTTLLGFYPIKQLFKLSAKGEY